MGQRGVCAGRSGARSAARWLARLVVASKHVRYRRGGPGGATHLLRVEGSYMTKDSSQSDRPRRRSQAQEDAVRKAASVSAARRSAAAKRRRDVELREAQERMGKRSGS